MPYADSYQRTLDIEVTITSQIRYRLGQAVRCLRVDVTESDLILTGQAPSYYAKQLAQHIAMSVSRLPLTNEIEVTSQPHV